MYILNTIQMDPSRIHRLIHVINNCGAQDNIIQIVTFCIDLAFFMGTHKNNENK